MDDNTQVDNAPSQQNQEGEQGKTQDPSDKLTPEHPRFKQVIADLHDARTANEDLKKQLEELKTAIETRQGTDPKPDLNAEELAALNKVDAELKRRGYLTKKELEEETRVRERAESLKDLSKEYDGKNGFPKFVADDVVTYARAHGFGDNYAAAYKDMHFDAIVQVQAKHGTQSVPNSEHPSGGEHGRPDLGMTADDIKNMSDADYEKNRDKILAALRPR